METIQQLCQYMTNSLSVIVLRLNFQAVNQYILSCIVTTYSLRLKQISQAF